MTPQFPDNEAERLQILRALSILDSHPEPGFDEIVALTKEVFNAPIVLISMVDASRQWFKAKIGTKETQGSRNDSFCGHAILSDEPMVVEDASLDPRFSGNPWVLPPSNIRFYAGAPVLAGGQKMGTLCVLDVVPRVFSDKDRKLLVSLARQVTVLLDDRLKSQRMSDALDQLVSLTGILDRQNAALREHEVRLAAVIDSLYEGLILKDAEGRVVMCNPATERIFGISKDQILGTRLPAPGWECFEEDGARLSPEDLPSIRSLTDNQPQSDVLMRIKNSAGESRWLLINTAPIHIEGSDKPSAVVCSFVDVTDRRKSEELIREQMATISETALQLGLRQMELEDANQKLQRLASTDVLTGIRNRRAFENSVEEGVARSIRYGRAISIALVDVDNFKLFNDVYGHQAGDSVLRNVAQILQHSVRESDTVARFGGEEFAIVMPETDRAEAAAACERLRRAIELEHLNGRPLTASFGVSTLSMTQPAQSTQELIELADRALYRSKELGRNRVTHASDLDSTQDNAIALT
jgi:diguanylate cyclase (GGDEF)-like protein/PAS domain S-box-containing protein